LHHASTHVADRRAAAVAPSAFHCSRWPPVNVP
jgi:hypothetical protein